MICIFSSRLDILYDIEFQVRQVIPKDTLLAIPVQNAPKIRVTVVLTWKKGIGYWYLCNCTVYKDYMQKLKLKHPHHSGHLCWYPPDNLTHAQWREIPEKSRELLKIAKEVLETINMDSVYSPPYEPEIEQTLNRVLSNLPRPLEVGDGDENEEDQ